MPLISQLFIQVSLDEFKLGRLLRHPSPGCPDGHLQLSEGEAGQEPPPGSGTGAGFFCGNIGNSTRQGSSVTTCNISSAVKRSIGSTTGCTITEKAPTRANQIARPL